MGMHVIITGNPVEGFTIIGPFTTADDAILWAMNQKWEENWWLAPLTAQAEYE